MILAPLALASDLLVWELQGSHLEGPAQTAAPVGSLMKPFVAQAWAAAHPTDPPPRATCDRTSRCWLAAGHGEIGLTRALALSCNTYFLALARATPPDRLAETLRAAGFLLPPVLTAEAAIGRDDAAPARIRPEDLMRSYVRLTREPWTRGEDVRALVLAGLRESAVRGTARGLRRAGLWAKTGTITAPGGAPWRTSGLALAVDDSGRAMMASLHQGTGREAAAALGRRLAGAPSRPAPPRAGSPEASRGPAPEPGAPDRVGVLLFTNLRPTEVHARNVSGHPAYSSRGYVGPGGVLHLRPGDRLAESRWSLSIPGLAFRRDYTAALFCDRRGDVTHLRAEMPMREYVSGVLRAELPASADDLRIALGAAALRFLARGPRHLDAQVCDSTHCAWFVGRGPATRWPTPRGPVLVSPWNQAGGDDPVRDGDYARMVSEARAPGPAQWSSDCGGRPLSAHEVWGNDDARVWPCPRHRQPGPRWRRDWPDAVAERAFGSAFGDLRVELVDGVWSLAVESREGARALRYDEVHRRLAAELGWGALPSPADRVFRVAGGWRAEGVGLGHRVGLCLDGRDLGADQRNGLDFARAAAAPPR